MTSQSIAGPAQLATRVSKFMRERKVTIDRGGLRDLLAVVYEASFKTEEGRPIRLQVVVGDPSDLDLQQRTIQQWFQSQPHRDIWKPWPFASPMPLTVEGLTKLALATDPRSSVVAVSVAAGAPSIWGLIDQQDLVHDGLSWDAEVRPFLRPGLLQVTVENVAHLTVWFNYRKVAELKGLALLSPELDVFRSGPVRDVLEPGFETHVNEVASELKNTRAQLEPHQALLARLWFGELSRLLLRMKTYRSGGALLITADPSRTDLNVRYELDYERLRTSLRRRAVVAIQLARERKASAERANLLATREMARHEVDGASRFVSLLTRVDGLVLLSPHLEVAGFGVKISSRAAAPALPGGKIPRAGNPGGTAKAMTAIDYEHYGTRHQSMFRYCQTVDQSLGLVLSQDGAVRAVTKVRGQVALWDGILLVRETRARLGRPRGSQPRVGSSPRPGRRATPALGSGGGNLNQS